MCAIQLLIKYAASWYMSALHRSLQLDTYHAGGLQPLQLCCIPNRSQMKLPSIAGSCRLETGSPLWKLLVDNCNNLVQKGAQGLTQSHVSKLLCTFHVNVKLCRVWNLSCMAIQSQKCGQEACWAAGRLTMPKLPSCGKSILVTSGEQPWQ